eukprot:1143724-Pelagomonas_calceolata.AAC.2
MDRRETPFVPLLLKGQPRTAWIRGGGMLHGLSFVCLWDNPHQKLWGRCPHLRVAVRGRESTVR